MPPAGAPCTAVPPAGLRRVAQGRGCRLPQAAIAIPALAPPCLHLGLTAPGGRWLWIGAIRAGMEQQPLCRVQAAGAVNSQEPDRGGQPDKGLGGCWAPSSPRAGGQPWGHTLQPCLSSPCSGRSPHRLQGQGAGDRVLGWAAGNRVSPPPACLTQGLSSQQPAAAVAPAWGRAGAGVEGAE